ncbi:MULTISPECIES: gliding motility-associated C-terminal domain-containing protein [unclassified Paraflavitalea]|uniref:T9SS type B sorting domain-containing protein n=1 Tax=unclassified Paraflavitalea TaxID=2798305 RepID=UPI003D35535D
MMKRISIFLLIVLSFYISRAQVCTNLGQNPSTAFPVCGVDTFTQSTVPYCGGKTIPSPCTNATLSDQNPFWYKFTCYQAGTLGFEIIPNDLADDYDWQIFDITGLDPNSVFTNGTLFVACNWSGRPGITGASAQGTTLVNCAGDAYPTFSSMPTLKKDHEYLLLVSHFTTFSPSQNGYKLAFKGGTASITDPKLPALQSVLSGCGGLTIGVKLNKKMKCSSLAANGSDFQLSPANGTIVSAKAASCNTGFDMDSVVLTISGPLTPGNYSITMKNGSDGNTLLDNCDRPINVGEKIDFVVFPVAPTPIDSIKPIGCAPKVLTLVMKQPILCSSIAANGSDFVLTGPETIPVVSATGNCSGTNTASTTIQITLGKAIEVGGTYTLTLQTGSDGNTILNDCAQQTPAGSAIAFLAKDTVNADFNYVTALGCITDTIHLSHPGGNGITSWTWFSNNTLSSTLQNPSLYYTEFGNKSIQLIVSNGVCVDTVIKVINLDNGINAAFKYPEVVCPRDEAVFVDQSTGKITTWNWDFGNGNTSILQNPPAQTYTAPTATKEIFYKARLIIGNSLNCFDTSIVSIKAVNTCIIAVPNAFTPNNDSKNDFLYPLNAYKADNLVFKIFNRYGQLIYETKDWTKKWDGTLKGNAQPTGTYVWTLQYVDRDTGAPVFKKGTTVLIR